MKTLMKVLLGLVSLTIVFACEDDSEDNPDSIHVKTGVQFEISESTIKENDSTKTVSLSFSKPAWNEGSIKVTFDTLHSKHFTTNPAASQGTITLVVKKNDKKAVFTLSPVNDTKAEGNRVITFTVSNISNHFQISERRTFSLKIEDDDGPVHVKDSYVNFIPTYLNLTENESEWHEIQLHVSELSTSEGNIIIEESSSRAVYGTHYITEPAFENRLLSLVASAQTPVVKFKFKTLDNAVISGNSTVLFRIKETSGNLKKGIVLEDSVNISDDELTGMPRGYEVAGGNWVQKRFFEYNTKGKISKVHLESYKPGYSSSVHTYYYNAFDQLIRINTHPGQEILYSWTNDKITLTQSVDNGIIDGYSEYEYNEAGDISGYQNFHLQPDGEFKLTDFTVLLYYTDGNLFKKMVYAPSAANPGEPFLISTETFENYLDKENPFPMVQVLPYIKTQKHLPTTYRLETNGYNLPYHFSYELRPDGKVTKRTGTGTASETAIYHYY